MLAVSIPDTACNLTLYVVTADRIERNVWPLSLEVGHGGLSYSSHELTFRAVG
jgi:hypothetical protein